MQLAPGLHRVGSDLVNVYLVADAQGVTVIDAGLPGQWSELVEELDVMGRSLDDIRGVVLTHGDVDHIGLAERLRSQQGVPVLVHEADAARSRGEEQKQVVWGRVRPLPLLRFIFYGLRRGGMRPPPLREVQTFSDGATLDLPGAPQVIHLPGHTPGSVAIWVPAVEAVFVGDALTTGHVLTGETGPQPAPFSMDPPAALAALARLEALPARWLLPGHGAPWQGDVDEAIAEVRRRAAGA